MPDVLAHIRNIPIGEDERGADGGIVRYGKREVGSLNV